jgi:hypothetical protein
VLEVAACQYSAAHVAIEHLRIERYTGFVSSVGNSSASALDALSSA